MAVGGRGGLGGAGLAAGRRGHQALRLPRPGPTVPPSPTPHPHIVFGRVRDLERRDLFAASDVHRDGDGRAGAGAAPAGRHAGHAARLGVDVADDVLDPRVRAVVDGDAVDAWTGGGGGGVFCATCKKGWGLRSQRNETRTELGDGRLAHAFLDLLKGFANLERRDEKERGAMAWVVVAPNRARFTQRLALFSEQLPTPPDAPTLPPQRTGESSAVATCSESRQQSTAAPVGGRARWLSLHLNRRPTGRAPPAVRCRPTTHF